jgi:hypothetical protein
MSCKDNEHSWGAPSMGRVNYHWPCLYCPAISLDGPDCPVCGLEGFEDHTECTSPSK